MRAVNRSSKSTNSSMCGCVTRNFLVLNGGSTLMGFKEYKSSRLSVKENEGKTNETHSTINH